MLTLRRVHGAIGLTLATLLFTAVGCGGGVAVQNLSVEGREFAFSPAALSAAPGQLKLVLANKGTIEHDFTIDSLSVKVHANAGETSDFTFNAAAGTYDFYCSIAGHKQAGMVGTLTVR